MRIAKAIYRWVVKNISYDGKSVFNEITAEGRQGNNFRRPQDAFFTFKTKRGICTGKANLVRLMMRMAGIPCVNVETIDVIPGVGHEFNAVFLEDVATGHSGWTLLDVTEAKLKSSESMVKNFLGFYSNEMNIEDVNRNILRENLHRICDIIAESYGDDNKVKRVVHIDGVNYTLDGLFRAAHIELAGNDGNKLKNIKIADEMVKTGMMFEIGKNIESLVIKGDEVVDVSRAYDLKSVELSQSNRYDGYDRVKRELIHKPEILKALNKELDDKLKEFNKSFEKYKERLTELGLSSREYYIENIREEALNSYNFFKNEGLSLTEKNVKKYMWMMDEGVRKMDVLIKKFSDKDYMKELEDIADKEKQKEELVGKLYDKKEEVIWSKIYDLGGFNSFPSDIQEEVDKVDQYYDSIVNNINDQNMEKAIKLIDEVGKKIDTFIEKYNDEHSEENLSEKLNNKW